MQDQRWAYFDRLSRSRLPRHHWSGPSPDDPDEIWFFETVLSNGIHIAIRQLTIEADGSRRRYFLEHLDDEWGFLTDQAVIPETSEGLEAIEASAFEAAWTV